MTSNVNNLSNQPVITAYVRNKRHKGHYATAGLFLLNGYSHIQLLYSGTKPISNSHAVLKAFGYLFKLEQHLNIISKESSDKTTKSKNKIHGNPINLYVVHHNLLNILINLRFYQDHNWPTTNKTSSDLYNEAKQANRTIDLSYLPSNYKDFIPVYKRLYKALSFFPAGINFMHTTSQSPHIKSLASFLNARIGHLNPTADYLTQHNRSLSIKLDIKTKHDFLVTCQKLHLDYQKKLRSFIVKFIKDNQK